MMSQQDLIRQYIRLILAEGGNARVRDRLTGRDVTYQGRHARSDQIYFSQRDEATTVLDRGQFIQDFQARILYTKLVF